jgi:PAS domain S-box-containing protein
MFRALFERSADAILLLDSQEQRFIDCNRAAVDMMGAASKGDLIRAHPAELSPQLQLDGTPSPLKTTQMIEAVLAKGSHRFEWLSRRFDGADFEVEVMATVVRGGNNPLIAAVCRDITGRKAAEAALRESEARFRSLFERSSDAMSLFDPELGRFIEANEAVARQIGAPGIEALRKSTPEEISPLRQPDGRFSGEKAAEMIRLALSKGSHRFEWLSRRFDGSELPIEVVLTAIPFGRRALLFAVSRDISGRQQAERDILELNVSLEQRVFRRTGELLRANEQLKRVENELRSRAAQMQKHRDGLLELARSNKSDRDRSLRQICSLAATTLDVARVSYWTLEDAGLGCEMLYLQKEARVEERARGVRLCVKECPAYFEALAARRPFVADRVLEHPATLGMVDNYLRPLGITSMLDAPVWLGGKVVGVLCHEHIGLPREWSAEEIDFASGLATMASLALEESTRAQSDLRVRESEEKFRALFEASSQGVILHDEEKMLEVNPACLRILGFQDAAEMVGKHPADTSAPIQPGGESAQVLARRHIQECMEKGHARFEWVARNSAGHEVPIEVILTRIPWGGRQLFQAVFHDITQRKQAEAELLKTLAREKELGQLRSNFVSMVSHEFRTPLGIIQSSAEILEDYLDQLEPHERKDHLRSIHKNTRRMASLMEEVLLIGSIEAGKLEYRPARLEPRDLIRRLVEDVQSATDHRCPIELALHGVPDEADGDARLLRHIFTNLLTNAVKYSERGAPVRFELVCEAAEVVAVIRDRGIGILPADQEWLFSAFHRGGNVGDRPGTGLGLVIVKRCVDLHGGTIKIESNPSEGTTVTVRLPRINGHPAHARADERQPTLLR